MLIRPVKVNLSVSAISAQQQWKGLACSGMVVSAGHGMSLTAA